jgi:phytoene dehydrogenase-like protein
MLAALELHPTNDKAGVYAPLGGFRRVASSMVELCLDLDVELRFDASVTSVTDDGVHFLSTDDDVDDPFAAKRTRGFLAADLVICNADVPFATESVLQRSDDANRGGAAEDDARSYRETYDWNDELDYSSGVIAFHWSVSRNLVCLNTHNVFMSANTTSDAEKSWAVLRAHLR